MGATFTLNSGGQDVGSTGSASIGSNNGVGASGFGQTGLTSFGGNSQTSNTGSTTIITSRTETINSVTDTNNLSGGNQVIANAPPPFVLPNGEMSIHSTDSKVNSVPIPSGQVLTPSSSSSVATLDAMVGSTDPNAASGQTTMTVPMFQDVPPPSEVSLSFTVNEPQASSSNSVAVDNFLSSSSSAETVELFPAKTSSSETFSTTSTSSSSSSAPFELIDMSSANAFGMSSSSGQQFDVTNTLTSPPSDSTLKVDIPPQNPDDPLIQVIEIPLLPEGQTAALLNVTQGSVTVSVDEANQNQFIEKSQEPINILSLDVGELACACVVNMCYNGRRT